MSKDSIGSLGEFGLIERLSQGLEVRPGIRLGIGDDCALLDSLSAPMVTADALVEGVHFRLDWMSPFQLGRKSMLVNVSDVVAMGGDPVAAFVCLALPRGTSPSVIDELYAGMESVAAESEFSVVGGDTVSSLGGLMISVTLVGETLPGGPILRSGAHPGDVLVVTGTLGDSAAGLAMLLNSSNPTSLPGGDYLLERHFNPAVRQPFMSRLLSEIPGAVHAGLDLSDGLAGDGGHLARRSGLKAIIEAEKLPLSQPCRDLAERLATSALDWALSGGEDYELLLAVEPGAVDGAGAVAEACGISLTVIGRCEAGRGEVEVLLNGRPYESGGGYTHF